MKRALLLLLLAACDYVRPFDRGVIEKAPVGAALPQGFWLGAATAPHQIEGGLNNDWSAWEDGKFPDGTPHIKNGDNADRAANSWEQWRDDVAALETLGANAYRLGIEWSRVEPQEDVYDEAAIARYREMFQTLRARGIEPVVTLFHFTLPLWLSVRGGWEAEDALTAFEDYARKMGEVFGAEVDAWITVNEPNVYALQGYNAGIWPPGVKDQKRQTRVYAAVIRAHAVASRALRQTDKTDADGDGNATFIGLAHHVRLFQAASSAVLDQTITGLTDDYFNDAVPRALETGRIRLNIPGVIDLDERHTELQGSADFLGINYYTRDYVRADLGSPTLSRQYVPDARPKNDLGWDVYPEGLTEMLVRFGRFRLPLIITENGIADAADAQRAYFIRAHLYAVEEAVRSGVTVKGYLHWSLIDNFEWAEGYSGRFGLFAIDFADPALTRVARPSTAVFREAASRRK